MRRRLMQVAYIIEPAIGEICILQDIKVTLLYIRVKAVKLYIIITVLGSEFSGMLSATVGINEWTRPNEDDGAQRYQSDGWNHCSDASAKLSK